MQLHQPQVITALEELEAQLLVISFAKLDYLKKWLPHFQVNFLDPSYQEKGLAHSTPFARTRFLSDPTLDVYHAYGLDRNKMSEVYSREVLRQYARWRKEGKPIKLPSEDPLQRGGNFVVDRAGRLTLSHTGHNQSERPTVEDILTALR